MMAPSTLKPNKSILVHITWLIIFSYSEERQLKQHSKIEVFLLYLPLTGHSALTLHPILPKWDWKDLTKHIYMT